MGVSCTYAEKNSKDFNSKNIFFFGKWVAKGGNPWSDVYTFSEDGIFYNQFDDSGISGKFTYNNGIIIFYARERYLSDEVQTINEEFSCKIKKINSSTIQIENTLYKNIDSITEDDNWYGDGASE
jgi:hypothetical protein